MENKSENQNKKSFSPLFYIGLILLVGGSVGLCYFLDNSVRAPYMCAHGMLDPNACYFRYAMKVISCISLPLGLVLLIAEIIKKK